MYVPPPYAPLCYALRRARAYWIRLDADRRGIRWNPMCMTNLRLQARAVGCGSRGGAVPPRGRRGAVAHLDRYTLDLGLTVVFLRLFFGN